MTTITPSNEKDVPVVPLHIELRDYFAAKAMLDFGLHSFDAARIEGRTPSEAALILAEASYRMADEMLKAREVKNV